MTSRQRNRFPREIPRPFLVLGIFAFLAFAAGLTPLAFAQGDLAPGQLEGAGFWNAFSSLEGTPPVLEQGGMIVHLGAGNGQLTAGLSVDHRFTVLGLEQNPELVTEAHNFIADRGLYGRVSVEQFDFGTTPLPFTDGIVNLIVVSFNRIPADITKYLAPGGAVVAWNGEEARLLSSREYPDEADVWTHFLHDASNNAVADDTLVAPPRRLQWVASPLWLRSHETPSGIQASICDESRLYYIFDEGLIGITDERLPDRWSLICRDAHNGRLLWRRPLGNWGWREWAREKWEGQDWTVVRAGRTVVPDQNHRCFVVHDGLLFATLEYGGPVSIIEATTGETIGILEDTECAREVLLLDGVALVFSAPAAFNDQQRLGIPADAPSRLTAFDAASGERLWSVKPGEIRSLHLAAQDGRVVYQAGSSLVGLDLHSGEELWNIDPQNNGGRNLLMADGRVVLLGGNAVQSIDAATGLRLWKKNTPAIGSAESVDLFVVDGLVWRGVVSVKFQEGDDGEQKIVMGGKTANGMLLGYDLETGEEERRILAEEIRSPEHHHRCYRNKATTNYILSGMEGIEMLGFSGADPSQNNWLRGACKYGIMPANGLMYVPPDQCFCHPGSKLLGFTAVKADPESPTPETPDEERLAQGPAFGTLSAETELAADAWPTFRSDASRSGSTIAKISLDADSTPAWNTHLGGRLTQPIAANGRVYVASRDEYTLYAIDAASGEILWIHRTGGRIDSPPTLYGDALLVGSADGRVTCLSAEDGAVAWTFLAAPSDQRIGAFDRFESVWPVHGSVLVHENIAYVAAGRSTYLDGGIRLWGFDPLTGEILHRGLLEGPHPDETGERDFSFYTTGANTDVLVAEGGFLYMRQKKVTLELEEVVPEILSTKGEADVGLHMFSTSGFLDDSWYNRTFWMYSQRWPGFQLANQAPKAGQLVVRDDEQTYAVRAFYRRNVHSPMFFPGTEGYMIFADRNENEPQIVGEEGARPPLEWLPQSDFFYRDGSPRRALDMNAFGSDKGIGYTRAEPAEWTCWMPIRVRAMVKASDQLVIAGPPDEFNEEDPFAPFEGRRGGRLAVLSPADGTVAFERELESEPVFDGMIAAEDRLFISLRDGTLTCFGAE
jgi:outer membrane protein assembly factor BamB